MTGTFQSSGGPLLIFVSGAGWYPQPNMSAPASATLDVAVQIDGTTIGHLTGFTNEPASHKTLPSHTFWLPAGTPDAGVVAAPAAGTHTLGLLLGNTTTTADQNDYFSATVVESRH